MKKLTLLVFMAADNNLHIHGIKDLNEMQAIGSSDDLNVVVEVDRRSAFSFETQPQINELHSQRLYVEKGWHRVIQDLGETNTGDPKVLKSFLEWGVSTYPAERYIVIVWNHGGGVKDEDIYAKFGSRMKRPLFAKPGILPRWVASDDTSQDYLDTVELKQALSIGHRLEIAGFDACLMSMFEVAYQLKDVCSFMVGSQEIEPPVGWPYQAILSPLVQSPDMPTSEIARCIVETYETYMMSSNERTTQSAISTEKIEGIARLVDALANRLVKLMNESELFEFKVTKVLRYQLQRFRDKDYMDLYHFADVCRRLLSDTETQRIAEQLVGAVADAVEFNACTGSGLENAHGLSILFPTQPWKDEVRKIYQQLDFTQKYSGWFNLIQRYYGLS